MLRGDVRRELNITSGLLCKLHRGVYVSRRTLYSLDSDYFQGISSSWSAVTLSDKYEVHRYARDYAPAEVCRVKVRHSTRVELYNSIHTRCSTAVRTWYSGYKMWSVKISTGIRTYEYFFQHFNQYRQRKFCDARYITVVWVK